MVSLNEECSSLKEDSETLTMMKHELNAYKKEVGENVELFDSTKEIESLSLEKK